MREGSEPNARLLRRKERDASRGSPGSFGGQKRPPQDDNLALMPNSLLD